MATNPKNLQVIVREANGTLKQLSFSADKKYVVNESVQLTVLETNGSRIPQDILLKRKGNDLLIEVSGQSEVFEVQGFYSNKAVVMPDASFAGPALDLSQAIANSATGEIVWSAGATSGTSWATLGVIGLGAIAAAGGSGGGSSNNPAPLTIDTSSPELLEEDIVAELDGDPLSDSDTVDVDVPLIYTFTFNEDIDGSSVTAADFSNAAEDGAAITIGSIVQVAPRVFTVEVTPTSAGSLQMQVNQNASIQDEAGNTVDTSSAIVDQETLEVVGGDPDALYVPFQNLFISVRGGAASAIDDASPFSGVWIDEDRDGVFEAGDTELTLNLIPTNPSAGAILTYEDAREDARVTGEDSMAGEDIVLNFYFDTGLYQNNIENLPFTFPLLRDAQINAPEADGWTIHYWDARMDLVHLRDWTDNSNPPVTLNSANRGIDITGFGDDDTVIIDMAAETVVDTFGAGNLVNDEYMGLAYSNDDDQRYISFDISADTVSSPTLVNGNEYNGFMVGLMNRPWDVWNASRMTSPSNEAPGRRLGGYDFWVAKSTNESGGSINYNLAHNDVTNYYLNQSSNAINGIFAVWLNSSGTSAATSALNPNVVMIVPTLEANTSLPNWWSTFDFDNSPRVVQVMPG
jgi:hypothetical protein